MSNLIKIQEAISNELNLKIRKLTNEFNNSLIDSETIIEEIEEINNNEWLKNRKNKKHDKKSIRRI